MNDRIKELRSALGLSQTEFAYQTGISHSLLTKIEAGDNQATNKVVAKIVDKWKVDEDWLTAGKGEMKYEKKSATASTEGESWKGEAWILAKEQLEKKDQTIDRLAVSFDRLTEFLSKLDVNFLHPVSDAG